MKMRQNVNMANFFFFQIKVSERISFVELLRRIKAAAADGNFDHLSDDSQDNTWFI
jgi:hypothetical protein